MSGQSASGDFHPPGKSVQIRQPWRPGSSCQSSAPPKLASISSLRDASIWNAAELRSSPPGRGGCLESASMASSIATTPSRKDAGEALGRSGDEGIDGIIKEDPLGLDIIYLHPDPQPSFPSLVAPGSVTQFFPHADPTTSSCNGRHNIGGRGRFDAGPREVGITGKI